MSQSWFVGCRARRWVSSRRCMVREPRRLSDSPNTRVSTRRILRSGQEEILGVGFVKDIVGAIGDTAGGNANPYTFSPVVNKFSATPMQGATDASQANLGQQQSYIDMINQQARGEGGPSMAQGMLQRGNEASNANAMSMMASQRGMNPALAAKMAMDQAGANNANTAQSAALLRNQE